MVFNPSAMVRFTHVIFGAWIQGAFLVMSVSAYYLIKKIHIEFAQKSFAFALGLAALASLAQPLVGHEHAKVVAEWQPAKLAAFEGLYETQEEAPLYLLGWTDPETEKTTGIAIPGMLSFLVHGDTKGTVKGLNEFPKEDWPAVNGVFQSYHLMVSLGMLFIGATGLSLVLLARKKLFNPSWSWLIKAYIPAVALPVIANQLGWISAERGRQPWIVQGLLRTSEGISKSIVATEVLISLVLFVLVYILLFFVWLYVLDREIKHGPEHLSSEVEAGYKRRADRMDVIKPTD